VIRAWRGYRWAIAYYVQALLDAASDPRTVLGLARQAQ
jgi:hypothetical protein